MLHSLLSGWALGLATGTTCLGTCAPIYIPYLIAEKRTGKQSFLIVLQITIGRFISYITFGAVFGFVGTKIPIASREVFTAIAYILLSIYLVASVFRIRRHSKNCRNTRLMNLTKSPFLLGILTGISFCPAFLIAISNAIDISGAGAGMTLFAGFFLGTSVFVLPITFLGALSNMDKIRKIAQVSAIIIAAYFIYKGGNSLFQYFQYNSQQTERSETSTAEPFLSTSEVYILTDTDEEQWLPLMDTDSISTFIISLDDFSKIPQTASIVSTIEEASTVPDDAGFKVIKINLENFRTKEDFQKLTKFMSDVYFRFESEKGYSFKIEEPPGGIVNKK